MESPKFKSCSLPSKFLAKYSPLLEDPGTYGAVPKQRHPGKWSLPQAYTPREKKPKTYASYNISSGCALHNRVLRLNSLSFTAGTRRNNDWSGESERERRGRTPPRQERAVSEPLIQKKKIVKFVQRSESEPARSSVEEELGMIGRLRLVKEVGEDAKDSLQDDQDE